MAATVLINRFDQLLERISVDQLPEAGIPTSALQVGTGAGTVASGDDSRFTSALQRLSNLADLASASDARTNLGLGNAAIRDVGTTVNTIAAGDDSRFASALQRISNLADLASASDARANLGLGSSATRNVGTGAGTVAAGDDSRFASALQRVSNLADLASASDARTNLGLGNAAIRNVGTTTGTVGDGGVLATKAPLDTPSFTGVPTTTSPLAADNSQRIPTTGWVKALGYVTALFPTFSGKVTFTGSSGSNFEIAPDTSPGAEPLWLFRIAGYSLGALGIRSNNILQAQNGIALNPNGDLNLGNSTNPYSMQRGGSARLGFGGTGSPAVYADSGNDSTTVFSAMAGALVNNPGSSGMLVYLAVGQTAAAIKITDAYNNVLTCFGPQGWLAVGKSTLPTAPLDLVGDAKATHFFASGTAPTIAAGSAAGSSPTIAISGTDHDGLITLTVGSSSTSGILATISFGSLFSSTPRCPLIGPASANAWTSGVYVDSTSTTTGNWKLKCDMALMVGSTYKFSYHVGA